MNLIKKINDNYILDENLNNSFIAGNKIRKVKAILDVHDKINGILTYGSAYSSHLLACAWWSRKLQIPFKGIVVTDKSISIDNFPNLKMSKILGADLYITNNNDAYKTIDFWQHKLFDYLWIPGGAHTLEASKSYEELFDKLFKHDSSLKQIESIILPFGTGTTAYGIWKSAQKYNPDLKIIGVSVSRSKEQCYNAISSIEGVTEFNNLRIIDVFSGKYGVIDDKSTSCRWRFFEEMGILPDPIYNSRSVQYYYENKLQNVLIINTGGMLNNLL